MALKTKMINSFKQSLRNKLVKPRKCIYCDLEFLSKDEYLCHVSIHPTEIVPNLFIGSINNAENIKCINQNGITHILYIMDTNNGNNDSLKINNMINVKITNVTDILNIIKYFHESFIFMDSALSNNHHNKILIVCKFGVTLSPLFVIGYLMNRYNLSLITSYNIIKTKRNIFNNEDCMFKSYWSQLQMFENMHCRKNLNNNNKISKKWQSLSTNKINIMSRNKKDNVYDNDDNMKENNFTEKETLIQKRIITMKSSIYEEKLLGNDNIKYHYDYPSSSSSASARSSTSSKKRLQKSYSSGYLPLNSHIVFTNI